MPRQEGGEAHKNWKGELGLHCNRKLDQRGLPLFGSTVFKNLVLAHKVDVDKRFRKGTKS